MLDETQDLVVKKTGTTRDLGPDEAGDGAARLDDVKGLQQRAAHAQGTTLEA